jgi:hypothetical protein
MSSQETNATAGARGRGGKQGYPGSCKVILFSLPSIRVSRRTASPINPQGQFRRLAPDRKPRELTFDSHPNAKGTRPERDHISLQVQVHSACGDAVRDPGSWVGGTSQGWVTVMLDVIRSDQADWAAGLAEWHEWRLRSRLSTGCRLRKVVRT